MSKYENEAWDMELASKLQSLGHPELDVYKLAYMLYNKRMNT